MTLSDYLKHNRITLADFGARIGVQHETVRRYAAGLRMPRATQMNAIISATDGAVTANDFFAEAAERGKAA